MKKFLLLTLIMMSLFQILFGQNQANNFTAKDNEPFNQAIATGNYLLIDVRTPAEYNAGHIPGAININVQDSNFESEIRKINTQQPVALYCRSGRRSKLAAQRLTQWGYQGIELNHGITQWDGTPVPVK